MDIFELAREMYREGRLLVAGTIEYAAASDRIRWARDDLEEDLLDLKLAVIEGNVGELPELTLNVVRMIEVIADMLDPNGDKP